MTKLRRFLVGNGWLLNPGILVALIAVLAAIAVSVGGERRATRALPDGQHRALYSRTLDDIREFIASSAESRPDTLMDIAGRSRSSSLSWKNATANARRWFGSSW